MNNGIIFGLFVVSVRPWWRRSFCATLGFALIIFSAAAQQDLELWYETPASEWTEALPVGNGRLGAMVFSDYHYERIQLNEESIVAGSKINNNNPEAKKHLSEIQQATFRGEYGKAWEMADCYLLGLPPRIRSYQPLGNLFIKYSWNSAPTAYRRSLHLNSGIVRTEFTIQGNKVIQEVFASSPDDIIVVRLNGDKPFDAEMVLSRERDIDQYKIEGDLVWFQGQIRDDDSPQHGPGGKHMRFSAAMKIISTDGKISSLVTDSSVSYKIQVAKEVTLILTGATDYDLKKLDIDPAADPLATCKNILERASKKKPANLKKVHEKDHRSFFDRVQFSLGMDRGSAVPTDERLAKVKAGGMDLGLVALYYQYGRYLLMSSSRKPGRLPANLQGIWNPLYAAPWNSDFHTNINLQMNYWPAETGNLSETSEVLAQFVKQITVPGAITAMEMYGARGWTLHHLIDVFGRTGVADGVWGLSPMAGSWMALTVYDHCEFTMDKTFLRDVAYPILKGSVQFVLDFLIESPEGYLVTNPSHSPENSFYVPGTGMKEKAYLSYAATIDIQIIQALFNSFIKSAGILKVDADLVINVRNVQKKLPPMKVGANGTLQEWIHDYEETDPGHRHISHLLGLYPLNLISPQDTVLFAAARKTIERRMTNSIDRHIGWSSAWIICFYARLLDGERAGAQVQRLLQYSTLDNLLNTIPPFQIDGNFGGCAGIAEMLLQSQNMEIHLLPALPASWQDGKMKGLRARGGYTVDMEWHAGRLASLVINAEKGGTCAIRYNDRLAQLKLKRGANILDPVKDL